MPAAKKKPAAKKLAAKKPDAKAAAKKQRAADIKSGALIEGKGDAEFVRVERTKPGLIQQRAAKLVAELKKSKTPVVVRDLIERNGGQFPQYLAMFQLLEAMGEVVPYRQRGGGRGEGASQVAYLHVDHAK